MKVFVFAVGGTGSRVLKSLIYLLAAGVRPKGDDGQPLQDLEIVPIIVDPHKANEDLKRTENLLNWYRDLRQELYPENSPRQGFFATKISTLRDLVKSTNSSATLSDTFLFSLGNVETKTFGDFIHFNNMKEENHALCSLLFSEDNLNTKMNIGFVGSPNIGSVALNQFKDSQEFKAFVDVFNNKDRVFVISSIFGGTGAAGFPIIVKNIRDAADSAAVQSNRSIIKNAKIGSLTVLPYFNIENSKDSPISIADFIQKTQSALYYYKDNLTGSGLLNACYYLGDEVSSNPYKNDPGTYGQQNDAHFIEFIGATSVLDFIGLPDSKLATEDGKALRPIFEEYALEKDEETVNLQTLGRNTRELLNKDMVRFHLFRLFVHNVLSDYIGQGFTKDNPQIKKDFLSTPFFRTLSNHFLTSYDGWLEEMAGNKRSFVPFILNENKPSNCINGIEAKKSFFKGPIDFNDILSDINVISKKESKNYATGRLAYKLLDLFVQAAGDNLLENKYNSLI
jgi:hypothetical protein